MSEKNGNGEKRWLTWVARFVLPAVIAALWAVQWASLSAQLTDLKDEVREMRGEVRDELKSQRVINREQDGRLARLDAEVGFLREDGRGD